MTYLSICQERDALSPDVKGLTQRLVSDYCLLYPESTDKDKDREKDRDREKEPCNVFHSLPSVCALFACNFITSATSLYSFAGV